MIDTAEKCSGGEGANATSFGHVEQVTVLGSICVKLIRDNQLDCVVDSQEDVAWDFTNQDILERFCYSESFSDHLPFPEYIEMISQYRQEPCVDDERTLQQAELTFLNNGTTVQLETCDIGNSVGLCSEDGQAENDIKIDASSLRTFEIACPKTCGQCEVNEREHYMVTVVPGDGNFAVDGEQVVPVQVTIDLDSSTMANTETQTFSSESGEDFSFEAEFHC